MVSIVKKEKYDDTLLAFRVVERVRLKFINNRLDQNLKNVSFGDENVANQQATLNQGTNQFNSTLDNRHSFS